MADDPLPDPLAAMIASFDQLTANMRPVANMAATYRSTLVDLGVDDVLADSLTLQLHDRMMATIFPTPNPLAGMFGGGG